MQYEYNRLLKHTDGMKADDRILRRLCFGEIVGIEYPYLPLPALTHDISDNGVRSLSIPCMAVLPLQAAWCCCMVLSK